MEKEMAVRLSGTRLSGGSHASNHEDARDARPSRWILSVPARSAGDRMDEWKEIAAYFKRSVRCVQRWERAEGMPVHRHLHVKAASVYSYRAELDAWWCAVSRRVFRNSEDVPRMIAGNSRLEEDRRLMTGSKEHAPVPPRHPPANP